ncbi:MAG: discoidin domain-containing protein [Prolixibacteraceae bacterium]|nr:discoidin domain-containing protein [Prolixibacteraceae bacterium]
MAYHSSAYDYNLTAQLITDGIITNKIPHTIKLTTNNGEIVKNEREWLLDHNRVTECSIVGNDIFLEIDFNGEVILPEFDKITLVGNVTYDDSKLKGWKIECFASQDGIKWDVIKRISGAGLPGQEMQSRFGFFSPPPGNDRDSTRRRRPRNSFMIGPYGDGPDAPKPSFTFNFSGSRKPQRTINQSFEAGSISDYKMFKISMNAPCAETWTFTDLDFMMGEEKLIIVPSRTFTSIWMSAGIEEEWVMVDLGTPSTFDKIKLYWVNKAKAGKIQVSDDKEEWKDIAELSDSDQLADEIDLNQEATGQYVRVLMKNGVHDILFALSEIEVYGNGGLVPDPAKVPKIADNKMYLSGGNWKLQRASEVNSEGNEISMAGFNTDDWLVATVPGTALVSYKNAGAIPNPDYSDNQLMISESFFNSDFWYRDEFEVPADFNIGRLFLNFDGINWKADVFVNGTKSGRIEGAFTKAKYDVTGLVKPGKNAIAIRIIKNENIGVIKEQTAISPDKNGGILGGDNPTFHASIGWDWIPTIRGRNIGIWNDVFLSTSKSVTIEDPFVTTNLDLPDTTFADISVELSLQNHTTEPVSGILEGKYGNISFKQEVTLDPSELKMITLDHTNHTVLHFENPGLWWPKGYGQQKLYDVELVFKTSNGLVSDLKSFKSGVREMSYSEDDDVLSIFINGRRFIGRGGNWGFPESNLNYRGREYDIAVALHADMNFTMIRNWVGQTGDDEFFEACDRHGIMVWQDFWLANPVDGPNPNDPEMFLQNARDFVKRIRNHPSIALYCGRNEGNPPPEIDNPLRSEIIPELHRGIHYISNSSMGVVSGGGPYRALPARDYYLLYGYDKLHSERGMPNVMNYESLAQTLPESKLWPQNSQWGLHDFCLEGAQGAASFNQLIENAFGPIDNANDFTRLAQRVNYDGYRAMFEGRSLYRRGLLLWMSHSAWPSMVWQTYDYYFDPTAAYFACKKASEPVHIQWNPVFDEIEVVNYNGKNRTGLTGKAQLINMDGSVQWENEKVVGSDEDSTVKLFNLEFPKSLSSTFFIKLTLTENGKVISDNFYWKGVEDGNYQALNSLPKVSVESTSKVRKSGNDWIIQTRLINKSGHPALMVRLIVVGSESGERILPVFYSDNYIALLPGEERTITMKLKEEDSRGEKPTVNISGFNIK